MPSPSPTARRIGPFRLLSVLGRGGMGTVHLAEHEAFGTRVALKCLRDDDPDARQLFLEEARAMCRLDHRHIARIFDHGVHEETPWFAMELAQSTLLAEAQLTPSWRSLSTSARQLLDALAHAHARGVVHRDLKPSNVLVATHDDLRPGVKLVDFGIAASSAQSPSRAGTPEYMAPEQWSGDLSAVGPWTDIYAVGNLFWALCCGRPPVQEDDMVATWGRQGRNDLDPFEPQFHVPSELEGWLRTCLRAYPGERFASVPDALKALDLAEGGPRAVRRVAARVAAADAPTVRNPTDTLDLEQTMTDERPLRARRRPSSAPIPESFDDVDMPAAPTHVAGTGLGALPWRQAPLVGRGREQQALWRTLRAVEADRHPRVVRLSGAPGVGRTALGTWLIQQVRANSGARAVRVTEAAGLQGLVDALLQPYGAPRDTSARERGLLRFDADDPASLDALSGLALVEEGPRAAGMVLDVLAALARLHTVVVFLDASPKATGLQALAERWAELPGPALLVVTDIDSPGATELRVPSLRPMAVAQAATSLLPLHPSLVRELADRAGGSPAELHAMLARAVPGLRLGPRGFELPHGLTEEAGEEATRTLPDGDRYLVELLAHLDATAPVSLWAQVAQRRRSELLRLSARLVDEGMASVERGTIRLRPSLRRRLLQQAATTGQSWDHHVAIASVLDAHDTLPMRRGQAWLDAGEHVRGVTVWLDHWRELLDDQGYEVLEGLLRDAQDRVRSVPPTEAVHGRLDALLPTVAARNYGNASASKGLARYRAALEQDWYDVAVDHLRWAMVCSDPSQRQGLLAEGMEALRDHCAPAAWAALLVYGVLAAPQWGRLDLEGPLVRSARRAVERAEADPDAGHSTIISAPLVPRLRHRLEAAIAAAQGDHVAEASALRAVVDVALSGRSPTLHADQVDLGLALLASGDAPAAEQVFLEGERRARWIGSWADAAGFATQRAGMAAIDGDWDRAARLARRALLGLVDGYPVAMMRLFATMPAVADGHLGTLFSEMDEIVTDLALVHPVDDELRRCMDVVLARLRELEQPVPASWNPLLELL